MDLTLSSAPLIRSVLTVLLPVTPPPIRQTCIRPAIDAHTSKRTVTTALRRRCLFEESIPQIPLAKANMMSKDCVKFITLARYYICNIRQDKFFESEYIKDILVI